jgi:hypothetical protein
MGRLIVSAQVTVDGVMDQLEGWFDPADESAQHGLEQLRAADALISAGKRTTSCPSSGRPLTGRTPSSSTPCRSTSPRERYGNRWTWNARFLGADAAEAVAALKAEVPRQLISYGCGELANHLARRGLVDEVRLWLHPVIWGDGVKAFHAGELPVRMRLIGVRTFPSSVVQLSYQRLES